MEITTLEKEKILIKRYLHNCNQEIRRGNKDAAKRYFDKAYKLAPNDSRVLWLKDNFYPPVVEIPFSEYQYHILGRILAKHGL